jgi:hypothetical protein
MRVQEKVFKIEAGVPRGKLARTRLWSQRSKPERKFEMRWIFEGDLRTDVVCKKCGTVSELENDFPVEWQDFLLLQAMSWTLLYQPKFELQNGISNRT